MIFIGTMAPISSLKPYSKSRIYTFGLPVCPFYYEPVFTYIFRIYTIPYLTHTIGYISPQIISIDTFIIP